MRRTAIIGIILFSITIAYAQDATFSQFYNSPLYLNPAFTGVNGGPRFTAAYRNQWPLLGNAYSTYFASYDQFFEAIGGGIGAMALSDVQGDGLYLTNSFTGLYSYQIKVSRKFALNIGVEAAFVQKRIQTDKLIFAENINPGNGGLNGIPSTDIPDNPSRSFADFGAGALFYNKKVFVGFAAKHLSQPDVSFYNSLPDQLPIRFDANAGIEFHKSDYKSYSYFAPNILATQQGFFKQVTLGAIAGMDAFYAGLYYRYSFGKKNGTFAPSDTINRIGNGDSFILLVGLQKGIFKMGYSYDIATNGLSGSGGSHEITVTLNFYDSKRSHDRINRMRVRECPKFF